MYKRRSFSFWYIWYHKCDMLARWSRGVNTGGSLTQLITDKQGHIGRSIWPLTPVRPLECKRLLQNIADTCDLKTSLHKQLDWNEMINPFRLNAPELVTQCIYACHLCCFISSDQLGYPRSYAVRAPPFVKPEHNGDNQHMKITSLL